jgi:hypothetical protein
MWLLILITLLCVTAAKYWTQDVLPADVGPSNIIAKLLTLTTDASYLKRPLNVFVKMKFFSQKFSGLWEPNLTMQSSKNVKDVLASPFKVFCRVGTVLIVNSFIISPFTKA